MASTAWTSAEKHPLRRTLASPAMLIALVGVMASGGSAVVGETGTPRKGTRRRGAADGEAPHRKWNEVGSGERKRGEA